MSNYQDSWHTTEHPLATAKRLLSPLAIVTHEADLRQCDEFLKANELGLAFECLDSIIYEDQPTCVPLLRLLRSEDSRPDQADGFKEVNLSS
jgi:hypothetical protein